jgi:hypothetical protein
MSVQIYPKQKAMVLPWRPDIANILPATKMILSKGQKLMALPHTVETTRLLYNFGIHTTAPIEHYYDWAGGTPFDSQRKTAAMLSVHKRAYVLSEMGVGKTRAALYALDYLMREGKVSRCLIIAPLSTLVGVWENEIFENFPYLQTTVLYGSAAKRKQLLAVKSDVYVINHDGIKVLKNELAARNDIDCIILDELAIYRNSKSERWKQVQPLVKRAKYVWGLTGSPTPNDPTDAYGQVKLLTPENVSFSFKGFQQQTMRQLTQFRWIARPEANENCEVCHDSISSLHTSRMFRSASGNILDANGGHGPTRCCCVQEDDARVGDPSERRGSEGCERRREALEAAATLQWIRLRRGWQSPLCRWRE